ncbi:MAG: hypothetical protein HY737_03020 [Candidatus Omnitrophica bacterium]|nr:hypothetical protein [Candidatus Omnitrophota bacterium]
MPLRRRKRLITELVKFRKNLVQAIENLGRRSPLWTILEIFVAIAAIGSMCFAGCQAILQQQQLRLENAPQLALHNVIWWYTPGDNWFGSQIELQNYGVKPALEFRFLNFRAIVLGVDEARIRTQIQANTDQSLQQFLDLYVRDMRNRSILDLLGEITSFFRRNTLANRQAVEQFLQRELGGNTNLPFRMLAINGDMDEYRARQRRMIVPNRSVTEGLGQQLDHTAVEQALVGNNLLVVYWAFEYEGADHSKYQSFYVGYGDRNFSTKLQLLGKEDRVYATLTEFQSWWGDQ